MKKEKPIWGSISVLIGVVIAIVAFLRGVPEIIALAVTFAAWGIWLYITQLSPRRRHRKPKKIERDHPAAPAPAQAPRPTKFEVPDVGSPPLEHLLLLHVNQRISAVLQEAYPQAVWQWCEKEPESIACKGGVGRIQVFGIADYEYADVTIDQHARIQCNLVRLTPLAANADPAAAPKETVPPNKQQVDLNAWYDAQGRNVLETVMTDLNSRGFTSLTLTDDGDIRTQMGDKALSHGKLADFPGRELWDKLVQVFEQNGMAAQVQGESILLSW